MGFLLVDFLCRHGMQFSAIGFLVPHVRIRAGRGTNIGFALR